MNRLMSVLLITVVTVIGFSMYQQQDVGHFSIRFADFEFESSLLVLLAASLVVLFALSLLYHSFKLVAGVFAYFGSKRKLRLEGKARQSLALGLIELAEGRFEQAEKALLTQIKHNDNALLAYLGAARAAQQQMADDRRDKYLRLAHELAPNAETAISITKAELQLDHKQFEQALATLTVLSGKAPKHAYVTRLLAKTYQKLHDWNNLKALIPEIKKLEVFSTDKTYQLEVVAWKGIFSDFATRDDRDGLMGSWNELPRHLKPNAELAKHYAQQLIALQASGEAEHVLRQFLKNDWDDSVLVMYSEIDVLDDNKQLETAEDWLQTHQNSAHLLLALGNMCTQRTLWGKARNYYEASLSIKPMPQTYLRLARLLDEHMEDEVAASEYYRQGLHLLAGEYTEADLQSARASSATIQDKPALKVV